MAIHASTVISLVPGRAPIRIVLGTIAEAADPDRVGCWFVSVEAAAGITSAYEGGSREEALAAYGREVTNCINSL